MNQHKSTRLGSIFELRAAMMTAEGEQIEQILEEADDAEMLTDAIRHALCNYVKEIPGVKHTENTLIWAVPIIFHNGMSRFITTEGGMVEVIDASTRLLMRQYFGAEYSVTSMRGMIPLNLLGSMPIAEHVQLFGVLAGDANRAGKSPVMTAEEHVIDQLKESSQPELAFMLGAITRVNRMPTIKDRSGAEISELGSEIVGRMSLHLNKFPKIGEMVCGAPSDLPAAYEAGVKSLIDALASKYQIGKPEITCSSTNDFTLRVNVLDDDSCLRKREIKLKRSIIGMSGIKRLYDHAASKECLLPEALGMYGRSTMTMH